MKTDDFDYYLPEELIAQVPLEHRESSRLLVLDKNNGNMIDDRFYDIVNYLNRGDVLVLNDTKVMPARIIGVKSDTGAVIEVLLLKNIECKNSILFFIKNKYFYLLSILTNKQLAILLYIFCSCLIVYIKKTFFIRIVCKINL